MDCVENTILFWLLQIVPSSAIPDGWMGLDIGPDSIKTFNDALDTTKTVIWNGPMGVFEFDKFAAGTEVPITILPFIFVLPYAEFYKRNGNGIKLVLHGFKILKEEE